MSEGDREIRYNITASNYLHFEWLSEWKSLISVRGLFVCNRGDTYYSITVDSRQRSLAKPLSLLFLTCRPALSSQEHRTLVYLFWSWNLHYAHSPANPTAACQAQAATAQTALSPSHPWVPPEWPYCQQALWGRWFFLKHNNAGLPTSSHPQNSASCLLGLQSPKQTQAFVRGITYLKNIIHLVKSH